MAEERIVTLDVRQMPPWERHPKIFELLDALQVGEALKLINDHNPAPLHYQLMFERKGMFSWEAHEEGPREWVARIEKIAAQPVEDAGEIITSSRYAGGEPEEGVRENGAR